MVLRGVLSLSAVLVVSASGSALAQPWSPEMHNGRIAFHAAANGIPPSLVRRIIKIESNGNPRLISKGNYGLMQIRLGTAQAMGYQGNAEGLLDPDINMTYAVKYLAGAYRAADGNEDGAVRNYQRGYYVSAKAKGFSPYAKPSVAAVAPAPPPAELAMPPAPLSQIAAFLMPAQTPAEIVRARMPKEQTAAAQIVDPNQSYDTKPAMPPSTMAMASRDPRPVQPRAVKIERQVAARPAAVKSDAPPVEASKAAVAKVDVANVEAASTEVNVPLPRPAPQRAAPTLASVEPVVPAPEVKKAEPPQTEAAVPLPPKRAARHEQPKPKVAAVPAAAGKPAASESEAVAPASGETRSLWSAFKSELSAAGGSNGAPARQQSAAAPAAEAAPAPAPKKKSAKEAEPFNLLTYVKKKITPDASKPEKKAEKKAPQS